ncbi:MAG: nucleotidyltransferase family protein [Lachnospiraceae bacterium]|nr:nucleotidyltransferase family protein [Lachnospiraceae bacterium]
MKTVAIIAEFNPFHNGHKYLLEQARKLTNAGQIIVIMSGNYVQRGGPAFLDKFTRTETALLNGADLVIELPFCYSMAKASVFAHGAVSILNSLGCVDYLCFGCETDILPLLKTLADISLKEPPLYKRILKKQLQSGQAFSHAKELALIEYIRSVQDAQWNISLSQQELSQCLRSPNNILAIEYLAALKKIKSSICPISVKRIDTGYHSTETCENEYGKFASATAIREMILHSDSTYHDYIPENTHEILSRRYQQFFPIVENDFSGSIGYRLNELYFNHRTEVKPYFDVSDTIMNRIFNQLDSFVDISSFVNTLNSKSITSAYIRRTLFQLLLQLEQQDVWQIELADKFPYIRVLGFNKKGAGLLKSIKKTQTPLITKLSASVAKLDESGKHILNLSMRADAIYRMTAMEKYKQNIPNEHQMGLIIKDEQPHTELRYSFSG